MIRSVPIHPAFATVLAIIALVIPTALEAQQQPMTFLDVREMRSAGDYAPSPDGQWMLYRITTPDWIEDESQSDIYVVSMADGVSSTRRLTYTEGFDESDPTWSPDGSFFVFLSNRETGDEDGGGDQLYRMRHDGGEARRITDAEDGVSSFAFSPDGAWLVYRSGESGEAQLYRLPATTTEPGTAERITRADAGVRQFAWSPDGSTVYFTRYDSFDHDDKRRKEEGFTVDIRNGVTPLASLWAVEAATGIERALEESDEYSVDGFNVSPDGAWIAFRGGSTERYERNITGAGLYADPYLLELATGQIEELVDNYEVNESLPTFSPDSRLIGFSGPDVMDRYSMSNSRIYVREVADRGGSFRKLATNLDENIRLGFWSDDGRTIYSVVGVKVTRQLFAVDVESGEAERITDHRAVIGITKDTETGTLLVNYQDPQTPGTLYTVDDVDDAADMSEWTQLTDVNPQVREMALGAVEEVEWTSTDGKTVGGVLVYPVGYQEGQRYPLIVSIHGGPASADLLSFNDGYGSQVFAGAGYAVLMPNYRGSTNYGNAHRTDIVGDYFTLGFDDIMTGVDHLIAEGIADGDRMGAFGWSAGGHWSNWILTHTDRFKAISSGAGTMNWISMYAQSDVQRNRQFYIGDDFLYENFDPYWDQSPLKYIANATTPTMIHVVEGDPRVPSPQSVELHMALKKLGVPTELFMYPGRSHGIPDARNRLVRSMAELAWMDHHVRGIGDGFSWEAILATLEEEKARPIS